MSCLEKAIKDYENSLTECTLCFLVDNEKVLLGYKKTGFGKGNLAGVGGKVEIGELPIQAAVREFEEEVNAKIIDPEFSGVMDFYFPYVDTPETWNMRVYVYSATSWTGDISESNELKPDWYDIDELPYHLMWYDNRYWIQELLAGEKIWAQFTIDPNMKVESWKKRNLAENKSLFKKGSMIFN